MLSILLLPFVCLSSSFATNETLKDDYNAFPSICADKNKITEEYKKAWDEELAMSNTYVLTHKEGSSNNDTRLVAEKIDFPSEDDKNAKHTTIIQGSFSSNDTVDCYYFLIPDRSYVWISFDNSNLTSKALLYAESPKDDSEKLYDLERNTNSNPDIYLKKGAYYLVVNDHSNTNANYNINVSYKLDDNSETVHLTKDIRENKNVLVWTSDFLPKNSEPKDGTTLYSKLTGKGVPSTQKKWLPIRSCNTTYNEIYQCVCIWKEEQFKEMLDGVNQLRNAISANESKLSNKKFYLEIAKKVNDAAGVIGYVISFINSTAGSIISTVNIGLSLAIGLIGQNYETDYNSLMDQLKVYYGALNAATDGTVIYFSFDASIKHTVKN